MENSYSVAHVGYEKITYPTGRLVYSPSCPGQGKILFDSIKFVVRDYDDLKAIDVLGICDEKGIIHPKGDGIQGVVAENGDYQLELLGDQNSDQIQVFYDYEYYLFAM